MTIKEGKTIDSPIKVYRRPGEFWTDGDVYMNEILELDRIFGGRGNYNVVSTPPKWTPFGSSTSYYIVGVFDKDGDWHKLLFTVVEGERPSSEDPVQEPEDASAWDFLGASFNDLASADTDTVLKVQESAKIENDTIKMDAELEREDLLTSVQESDKVSAVPEKPKSRKRKTTKSRKDPKGA